MDTFRESIEWSLDGPLGDATGLPAGVLYAVVLAIAHDGGRSAVAHVRKALASAFGAPAAVRRSLLGTSLEYAGTTPVRAEVRGRKVRLTFGTRVKAARVRDALEALAAELPGARDARLTGEVQRYAAPGALRGPPLE
jgi:hypothetical protein